MEISDLKISISSGIDWLSCTISATKGRTIKSKLKDLNLIDNDPEMVDPLHGYSNAIKLNGGRLQWGFPNDDYYYHFELTGEGCQNLGNKIWDLLVHLKFKGAKFTRIDLAFDFMNTKNIFNNMRKDLENNNYRGFQTWQEITTNTKENKATSFYIGSRSSMRFLRVYDKGLESGLFNEAEKLIRFEFVFRGQQSVFVGNVIIEDIAVLSEIAGLTFNIYRFGFFNKKHGNRLWNNSEWY